MFNHDKLHRPAGQGSLARCAIGLADCTLERAELPPSSTSAALLEMKRNTMHIS
jgi:hypothetical protein